MVACSQMRACGLQVAVRISVYVYVCKCVVCACGEGGKGRALDLASHYSLYRSCCTYGTARGALGAQSDEPNAMPGEWWWCPYAACVCTHTHARACANDTQSQL